MPESRDPAVNFDSSACSATSVSPNTAASRTSPNVPEQVNGGTDTLFYDGQCPLCAAEIGKLRSVRGGELQLIDIHSLPQAPTGVSKDELLRTLHLQRSDGRWVRGADANVAAWEGTGSAKLWRLLRLPLLRTVVDGVYGRWAAWRYRRLYGEQFVEKEHAP